MCHFILLPLPVTYVILLFAIHSSDFNFVHGDRPTNYTAYYTEKLESRLKVGDQILVAGNLTGEPFYIDLMTKNGDIPLHMTSRQNKIVYNSMENNNWFSDEILLQPSPLDAYGPFNIRIIIDNKDGFDIMFNNRISWKIEKRLPLDDVDTLRVFGDFSLYSVQIHRLSNNHSVMGLTGSDENSSRTSIIAISITFVLLIVIAMIIFYVLRRRCTQPSSKTPINTIDSTMNRKHSQTSSKSNASDFSRLSGLIGDSLM